MSWGYGLTNQNMVRSEQITAAENVLGVNWWPYQTAAAVAWAAEVSPRRTKRGNSKPDASSYCGPFPQQRIVVDRYRSSHVDFLTTWFVASSKFWVDDGMVVVAAEDDATVSLITDVSMVQQMERLFRFDGQFLAVLLGFDGPGSK